MQYKDLTDKTKKLITNYIETLLKRFGIDVKVTLREREDNGWLYIYFDSTEFTTFPRIFNKIWVLGDAYTDTKNGERTLMLKYQVRLRWELFDGGTNGCTLGFVTFTVTQEAAYQSVTCYGMETSVSIALPNILDL